MVDIWYLIEDFGPMIGNIFCGTYEECEKELNTLVIRYKALGKKTDVFNITLNRFD